MWDFARVDHRTPSSRPKRRSRAVERPAFPLPATPPNGCPSWASP